MDDAAVLTETQQCSTSANCDWGGMIEQQNVAGVDGTACLFQLAAQVRGNL